MSKSRKTKQYDADGFEYRIVVLPEIEQYDDSFIDTWTDESEKKRENARRKLWARIESEGVWCATVERRHKVAPVACEVCHHEPDHAWEHVDSIGMCVGDEWKQYMLDAIPRGVQATVCEVAPIYDAEQYTGIDTVVGTMKVSKP